MLCGYVSSRDVLLSPQYACECTRMYVLMCEHSSRDEMHVPNVCSSL